MTSGQESSQGGRPTAPTGPVESLAGVYHPHAIEVQDFSHYALVIDVRSPADYQDDHIPGAVQLTPPLAQAAPLLPGAGDDEGGLAVLAQEEAPSTELPAPLAALVAAIKPDQAILLYCGRGGQDSLPLARALRWRGWSADVLPGGWVNYRRWVQVGLDVLPRLLTFRVVVSSLGSETARVLRALRTAGQPVLDVEGLAGFRHGALLTPASVGPPQAWFESQLLQALRELDPSRPVWVGDVDHREGSLALPGVLSDALERAPAAVLQVDPVERLRRWREDEPLWRSGSQAVLRAVVARYGLADRERLVRWQQWAAEGMTDALWVRLLNDGVDQLGANSGLRRRVRDPALPPLVARSLAPTDLVGAVQAWLPTVAADGC
jgi:tRNA 2-selenouridine synthase